MEAATATKPTIFRSIRPGFVQTIEPADFDVNNKGQRYNHTPGVRAEFGMDFLFETEDPAMIEALRKSRNFNLMFFEEGREPDRPLPSAADQLSAITRAAVHGDVEAIAEVLRVENEPEDREIDGTLRVYGGYKRQEVLAAGEEALSALAGQ